jgi:hypothetical protein
MHVPNLSLLRIKEKALTKIFTNEYSKLNIVKSRVRDRLIREIICRK